MHSSCPALSLTSITSEVMEPPLFPGYDGATMTTIAAPSTPSFGDLLREWRQRRRLSQLDLSTEASISTRHLSFVETGRSSPSREMVLHLAERLEVPLRERNQLLVAAGFAPVFPEKPLSDPALSPARKAVETVLKGHEPYPALAIDRYWNLVAANAAISPLLAGVDANLLVPPVNVLRLSLHPGGLASRIVNLGQWRAHLFARLRRQSELTADPFFATLLAELSAYPASNSFTSRQTTASDEFAGVAVPLRLATEQGILSLLSTTMVFGTAVDVTVSELAIESFFPTDTETVTLLQRFAATAEQA
jgi:transcriptional regulator with XRE-family HTH domain